jgi:hypothetical protein
MTGSERGWRMGERGWENNVREDEKRMRKVRAGQERERDHEPR